MSTPPATTPHDSNPPAPQLIDMMPPEGAYVLGLVEGRHPAGGGKYVFAACVASIHGKSMNLEDAPGFEGHWHSSKDGWWASHGKQDRRVARAHQILRAKGFAPEPRYGQWALRGALSKNVMAGLCRQLTEELGFYVIDPRSGKTLV